MRFHARSVALGSPELLDATGIGGAERSQRAAALESAPAPEKAEQSTDTRLRHAVHRHVDWVWRILRRAGLGAADAEDAAQDVFWIFSKRMQDIPERAEAAFLATTALRVASDRRRCRWNRSVVGALDPDARASTEPSPEEAVDRRRALHLFDEALSRLDAADRDVFILADVEQLSRTETARALGIPEGTVASRLRRARATVESALSRALPRTRRSR